MTNDRCFEPVKVLLGFLCEVLVIVGVRCVVRCNCKGVHVLRRSQVCKGDKVQVF